MLSIFKKGAKFLTDGEITNMDRRKTKIISIVLYQNSDQYRCELMDSTQRHKYRCICVCLCVPVCSYIYSLALSTERAHILATKRNH